MSSTTTISRPAVGETVSLEPRLMNRERMRWYCDALETAASQSGEFIIAEPTIHTDDEYAKAQGLPGIIADGMISTNWISSLVYREYGLDFLAGGSLETKFIRPVYEDETLRACATVVSDDGVDVALDVWCETEAGKVTVGSATVRIGAAA